MSKISTIDSLFATLLTGDTSVIPALDAAILEGVCDAGKTVYALVMRRGYTRGGRVEPAKRVVGRYTVVVPGKTIRVVGLAYPAAGDVQGDRRPYDRVFSRGFVHVQCPACHEDKAVAFSCKLRGLCPSCAGRRMAGTAAHLVDCVLRAVRVRQYVLAFPYELSGLAATRPEVLRALSRIFWEALRRRYQRWAKRAGHATTRVETGAVTGVHRAGASLNVHVYPVGYHEARHFHVLCLDGVYVETEAKDGTLRFEAAPAPSREELQETVKYVYARVMKWLARRGLLREADASNEAPSYSAGEAMTLAGMQRGTLETAKDTGERAEHELAEHERAEPPPRVTDAAVHERFNLHASVHVPAYDDLARERLCRYLARPGFSLARLGVRRDGLVVYRVKNAGRGRVKQRVMSPVECLARLAAMVPPPRYPLLRLHGVLAPRHPWRARVVPRPPESQAGCATSSSKKKSTRSVAEAGAELAAAVVSRLERPGLGPSHSARTAPAPARRAASLARPTRRRLTSSPLSNARHVAPWPPPVRRSPSARPTSSVSGIWACQPTLPGLSPLPCAPWAASLGYSPLVASYRLRAPSPAEPMAGGRTASGPP